jgi:uncharacterized protein YbbC (DUF1343 family)
VTRLGIDVLLADPGRFVDGRRVALLANQASLTGDGSPTLEALREAPSLELVALLTPEHGWSGLEDDATPIEDRRDPRTGLPLWSLYGPRRRPAAAALRSVDAVVVDLQEVGVRCYTYATTVALLVEAAAETRTPVLVCDRPNLLGPRIDGPALDPALRSFLGYLDVPYQHGLTMGALLAFTLGRQHPHLRVAPMEGWQPGARLPAPFVPPSPGLPTAEAVALYPGLVLLEGTNLSEGRGTTLPFQLMGAPWLDGYALARELSRLELPGLRFRPVTFRPRSDRNAGELCQGVQWHVVEPQALRPLEAAVRVLTHVRERYEAFAWTDAAAMPWAEHPDAGAPWHEPARGALVDALVGDASVRSVVDGGRTFEAVAAEWQTVAERHRARVGSAAEGQEAGDSVGHSACTT